MAEAQGHAAHSKASENQKGLPGAMPRPIKLTMLGAGSGFTPTLVRDVLCIPGNERGQIALVDIDPVRLEIMHKLIAKLLAESGRDAWTVQASTNRLDVLAGSDYIVNCIEVSGVSCVRHDNDIPLKYGIDQCIGDTIGPGGLFKGLRTIPVFLDILRDATRVCPEALVLNYTNPMSMMCLAANRAVPRIQLVGLCHSVQGTSHLMAQRAGVPYEQMEWECAGINHLAFFTKLRHHGKDLYPLLKEKAAAELEKAFKDGRPALKPGDPRKQDLPEHHKDIVRKDVMLQFGYFVTESSGHFSEYVPYYRKRKDLVQKYSREGYLGGSSFYANEWPGWRKSADEGRQKMLDGSEPMPKWERSWEYASWIIEAREKDTPYRIHGNVMNVHPIKQWGPLIHNLMHDGCVEVACMIDRNGINPTVFGKLPPQCAALCESNMRVFDLAATAAVEKSKEAAIHALMLDPLCAACCSPAEIRQMTLELFEAEKEFLPGYR